jgi:protein-tyrosine phosphatase
VELPSIARVLDPARDFNRFDWLIAMDRANVRNLLRAGADEAKVRMIRSFDPALTGRAPAALEVPDPYDGSGDGFEAVFRMLDSACEGLLACLTDED